MTGKTTYRPDIDGLRAIAVIPVLLYHLNFSWIPGGFTGVDVFFVISGYLITSIIAQEIKNQEFSFIKFYERRFRRIIPALFFVLLFTLLFGYFLQIPNHYKFTSDSEIFSILFSANIFFWKEANYFSGLTDLRALIHMWSLAVEEQFYMFFPVLAIIAYKIRNLKLGILVAVAVSLILSIYYSAEKPTASFYLIPTRAWELGIGSLMAVGSIPKLNSKWLAEMIATTGLMLLFFSYLYINSQMIFPGQVALLPTFGSALIIWAGVRHETYVTRALSFKPVVYIGLISYSLYLWHWPIIVMVRNILAEIDLSWSIRILIIIFSLAVAILSYRLVETPFRNRNRVSSKGVWIFSAASIALLFLFSATVSYFDGLPSRLSTQALAYALDSEDTAKKGNACLGAPLEEVLVGDNCRTGSLEKEPTVVLWGDSFAAALEPALDIALGKNDVSGIATVMNSCPPLMDADFGFHTPRSQLKCNSRNSVIIDFIKNNSQISTVVLFMSNAAYVRANQEKYVQELSSAIEKLASFGKRVILVHGLPLPNKPVPWLLSRLTSMGHQIDTINPPDEQWLDEVENRISKDANEDFFSLEKVFCHDKTCELAKNGNALYVDSVHLSRYAGENQIAPKISDLFRRNFLIDN